MHRAAIHCLGLLILLAAALGGLSARADTPEEFAVRVQAAYGAPDKIVAIKRLFYFQGVDAETMKMYDGRIITRMMGKYDSPRVTLGPLGKDFMEVQVMRGYEYRPNLEVLGYVVLDGKTHVPYGAHEGKHYFTAMTRKAIEPPPAPDKMLQMLVIGLDATPLKFDGYCDVLLANGQTQRMAIEDGGAGARTTVMMGQLVSACEIVNRSNRGALQLRILEEQTVIFEHRVETPETVLRYSRPAAD